MFFLDLRKVPCPKCGRKGLHFPNHPHAYGYKDHTKAVCRFCHSRFKIREPNKPTEKL